jgi:hypothetical protein
MGYHKEFKVNVAEACTGDICAGCGAIADKRVYLLSFAFAVCKRCSDLLKGKL